MYKYLWLALEKNYKNSILYLAKYYEKNNNTEMMTKCYLLL